MSSAPDGRRGTTSFGPFDIRWSEQGPADGARVVLLHGIYAGAHAYEWRELVPLLADTALVRVPDLLGAGASDRPPLAYTPRILHDEIATIVADAGAAVHVVASSLTGAYALRAAAQGVTMASLTLVTPTGMGSPREAARAARGHRLFDAFRATPLGDAFVHVLTSGPSVTWFQRHRTYRAPDVLTREEVTTTRRAGRLPGAKYLQLAFVFDRLSIDVAPDDIAAVRPTVVWATGQRFVDEAECDRWRDAGATVIELPSGLPQVEEPARLADVVRRQLDR
jgi:pimeloyl-ACP methyl ester carboxylesterase